MHTPLAQGSVAGTYIAACRRFCLNREEAAIGASLLSGPLKS